MCTFPVTIPNPVYDHTPVSSEMGVMVKLDKRLYSKESYISVPCGKCDECRSSYYNSILQRALVESRTSYMYFITLTYDNKHIPSLILPTGQQIYYSDYTHIQDMLKRMRHHNVIDRDFRYLCVNEYGDQKCRPHFHLILFISRLSSDTAVTPYLYEKLLFDNIKKYFAVNIGTRKKPVYECLFTYTLRYTNKGVKTNYFVKYVSPDIDRKVYNIDHDSPTYIKTIRYLLGYINKGSSFDKVIEDYLSESVDRALCNKLRYILRSRVRYSKGFGCGFDVNGDKVYLPRISVKCSSNMILYSDLCSSLPDTFSEFYDLYPDNVKDLQTYILNCPYKNYESLDECLSGLTERDIFNHFLILKYFPKYFNTIYIRYFRDNGLSFPCVSYFYEFLHRDYKYVKPKVKTVVPVDSDVFRFLRAGVDEGISVGVPFIAFKNVSDQSFQSLCKYYRQRVTTSEDILSMYGSCGVSDYDSWLKLFNKYIDTSASARASGNRFSHDSDQKICKSQKSCISLPQVTDVYAYLFGRS